MASTVMPRLAARWTYSSGCDAPVRKVKLEVMQSSANMIPEYIHVLFFFESYQRDCLRQIMRFGYFRQEERGQVGGTRQPVGRRRISR